jgi:hypothetical protein
MMNAHQQAVIEAFFVSILIVGFSGLIAYFQCKYKVRGLKINVNMVSLFFILIILFGFLLIQKL